MGTVRRTSSQTSAKLENCSSTPGELQGFGETRRRFAKGDRGGNQQGCDSMFQVSFTKCHFRSKFSFVVAAKKLRDQIPSAIFGLRIFSGVFSHLETKM